MAKLALILQAMTARFHADELRRILSQDDCKRVLASVEFVSKDGVDSVATPLRMLANIATFFVGIRNDITSIQAVKALLSYVCEYSRWTQPHAQGFSTPSYSLQSAN